MSKGQLVLWTQGQETVKVVSRGVAIVIQHRITRESATRELVLPRSRALLLALREACDQALRAEETLLLDSATAE